MKPYYEHAGITIYHGDCREILPSLPVVAAVVTDPPYGINAARERNSEKWGWRDFAVNGWDAERPSDETLWMCMAKGRNQIIWGANYFLSALPKLPRAKWLVWDKGQTDFSLADCELAWCSWEGAIRRISYSRGAALQDGKKHPTQKPLTVMGWCLAQLPEQGTVLDPFAGSGTTLRAAKDRGLEAIGIEIEERYCEIAAKRLAQEVLPLEAANG